MPEAQEGCVQLAAGPLLPETVAPAAESRKEEVREVIARIVQPAPDFEAAGVDIRGRFLIDPEGVLQAMEVLTPEVGRNVAELIRQVKAYQHVQATGEVTPSGWQPGRTTLTPGPALVGTVWKEWDPEQAF